MTIVKQARGPGSPSRGTSGGVAWILVAAIALLAVWLGRDRLAKVQAATAVAANRSLELDALRGEAERLEQEETQLQNALFELDRNPDDTIGPDDRVRVETLRLLAQLKDIGLVTFEPTGGGQRGPTPGGIELLRWTNVSAVVSDRFVELFHLSTADTAEIQRAVSAARRQADGLQKAFSTAWRDDSGAFVVETQPIPLTEYERIATGVGQTLNRVLGPESFETFEGLSGGVNTWLTFPSRPGLRITRRVENEAGVYKIQTTVTSADGDGGAVTTSTTRNRDTIRTLLGEWADQLPADF